MIMLNDFHKLQFEGEDAVTITGLISLGKNAKIQGKYQDATQHYLQILEIAFQTANTQTKVIALAGLGSILTCCHQYEVACEYYQQQLKLADNINNILWKADAICSLGYMQYFLKNYDKAIQLQDECLKIIDKIESREIRARRLCCLGMIDYELQKYQAAIDFYTQSIEIYQEIKLPLEEAETLVNLASAEREAKRSQAVGKLRLVDLEVVVDNLHKVHSISDMIGDSTLKAKALQELAITYKIADQIDIAINKCNSALDIAIKIKSYYLTNECMAMLKKYKNHENEQE